MVEVAARDETAGESVTFGVRAVTFGWSVFSAVTVGAPVLEFGVGEAVFNSPAFFEPRSLRL
jgi:hypothetical protein